MADYGADVNWVQAISDCTLDNFCKSLAERMKADTARWKDEFLPLVRRAELSAPFIEYNGQQISADWKPDWPGAPCATISKELLATRVLKLHATQGSPTTHADKVFQPFVNDKGECRIKHGTEELQLWQVSRLILEPILFPPELGLK